MAWIRLTCSWLGLILAVQSLGSPFPSSSRPTPFGKGGCDAMYRSRWVPSKHWSIAHIAGSSSIYQMVVYKTTNILTWIPLKDEWPYQIYQVFFVHSTFMAGIVLAMFGLWKRVAPGAGFGGWIWSHGEAKGAFMGCADPFWVDFKVW